MKIFFLMVVCCSSAVLHAQELYPYTEPASNMPSHSLSAKFSAMFERDKHTGKGVQRYSPEVMLGVNKAWMVHVGATLSNMQTKALRGESVRLYAKYRFLSADGVHKHFRMAAFALGSYSRNQPRYNELNLYGDQSGAQAGIIATQLLYKLALSGTLSFSELLNKERWRKETQDAYAWRSVHYSVSAGYLLFPLTYTNYKQTNVNLYIEVLGSRNIAWPFEKHYVDVAPAVQAIFSSTGKLNLGYRFQVSGDVARMANRSFMVSYEHLFLAALRRKR